ncbi:MAG: DNRLRE domain-containing protein, partial [Cytophagales bacterium]|nr:DNRLRE domain-containing protein [Cytophagales bacterium]
GDHVTSDKYYRSVHAVTDPAFDIESSSEWVSSGTVTPGGAQDFSYETAVLDNDGNMHVVYRQRAANIGIQRGLYYKSMAISSASWGDGYGFQLMAPPAPYNINSAYLIFYHRLWVDRANNVHFSTTFYEGDSGANGLYPRIAGFRDAGTGDGVWKESSRHRYLENILNGKQVQQIDFSISDHILTDTVDLSATTNIAGAAVEYELVSGPAILNGSQLSFTGAGTVTVKAKNSGTAAYYADESLATFQVFLSSPGLTPEADAFVRDGTYADINFGKDTWLQVKKEGPSWNRKSFFRFDLSEFNEPILSAKLKLVPIANGTAITSTVFRTMFVADDSWEENSLTWNNQPAIGAVLDSVLGSTNATEWDITAQAEIERQGDGKLSLALESTTPGSQNWIAYNSREVQNAFVRPVLIVVSGTRFGDLSASKDAYVQNGGSANTNYGSSSVMVIKNDGPGYNRQTYLQFDLSSVGDSIVDARLKLTRQAAGNTIQNTTIEALFVSDDNWQEAELTWNNKPDTEDVLYAQDGGLENPEWDISAQAEIERNGDGVISILLRSTVSGSGSWLSYASKENSNYAARPRLTIITSTGNQSSVARIYKEQTKEDEMKLDEKLAAYPNPVNDLLILEGDLEGFDKGAVYTANGILVKQFTIDSERKKILDWTSLENGFYLLRLTGGDKKMKVIRVHKK